MTGPAHLSPANLLSGPVVAVSTVWLFLLHFSDARVVAAGITPARIAAFVLAQVALFAAVWLLAWPVRRLPMRAVPVATCGIIALAGLVRAAVLDVALLRFGVIDQGNLWFFAMTSLLNVTLALTIMTVAVGEVRQHRATKAHLLSEQEQLQLMTQRAAAQVRQVDQELVSSIQDQLMTALQPLAEGNSRTAQESLKTAIDQVIRPFSRALESASERWEQPPKVPVPSVGMDWRSALGSAFRPSEIRPLACVGIPALMAIPASLTYYGFPRTVLLVLYAVVIGSAVLMGVRAAALRLQKRVPTWLLPGLFFVALLSAGIAIGLGSRLVLTGESTGSAYVYQAPMFIVLIGAIVAFADAARTRAAVAESAIRRSDEDLRWTLARLRETERQSKRALAHALHGQVQSALTAALLRVQSVPADPAARSVALATVRADVEGAVAALDARVTATPTLATVLDATRATWHGIVVITDEVSPPAAQRLAADPIATRSISDLIPELCFNAVKHAEADTITIRLEDAGARALRLTVANDGSPDLSAPGPGGLGDQLLTSAALRWQRSSRNGQTLVTALIPVA